ncbi:MULTISPECIES: hypothetical protein [Staphylococcaceae]|uniref:Uncharacterized protein n=1 Tax=Macrococcus hajekii TaxID=198482 RepID=A0A4R6BHM2_9STAP|nr:MULTISPECIES: hypothetical protein [Macrococcus]MDJ1112798.1 hypothetical protein [Macrococcus sp. S115]MDJ1156543.1 hypothetical protein [Macrococcus caseolyticus]PKD97419.1 hypothetical protein CW719_11340 [Macrococcus caseolyticus]PKE64527.1 hypothetical protein CW674_11625 [Macrococcus caseolyticus]PKE73562.1 hypothetical protein CW670_11405 [Macrococcus caseolyticus]
MNKIISLVFSITSYILYILVVISPSSDSIEISDKFLYVSLICSVIGVIFGIIEKNKAISIILIIVGLIPIIVFVISVMFSFLIA